MHTAVNVLLYKLQVYTSIFKFGFPVNQHYRIVIDCTTGIYLLHFAFFLK